MKSSTVNTSTCEKNNKCGENIGCELNHNDTPAGNCEKNNNNMRLNKAIAVQYGYARRKADEFIFAGKVKVNGKTEKNPAIRVGESDVVELVGHARIKRPTLTYVILNKPVHCVCTRHDPQRRKTVMDFLPEQLRALGLFPVGRLDYFSEGLLLLTNDGELAQRLNHPGHKMEKLYEVLVRGSVPSEAIDAVNAGMILEDGTRLLPAPCEIERMDNGNTCLRIKLRQGINRQIRKMMAQLNLVILRLQRVAIGEMKLGSLSPGKYHVLNQGEVTRLRSMAGLL